ncbi:ribonuclease H-like domain-containing protein [Tanacetum coccineum]
MSVPILSLKFKFVDKELVILRAPRKNDVYSLDLKNIIPSRGVTCLVAKATKDEAVLWHRRLGHVNFKNINKLGSRHFMAFHQGPKVKVFTFYEEAIPRVSSCSITPLTPPMLEVVTALAAEEAHSTSPHSRAASSPRMLKKYQAEWDAEEERKRFEELKKAKPKTTLRKPTSLAHERNQMMNFLKGQGYKNLQKLKYPQEGNLIVDFEKNAQDRESLEGISMITELQVIDSPDGEYLIIHRANNHFRAFDTLWEILHILDRQDLYHLYRVIQDYYEHIPPTGLGLILLGVHTLELEDGTMIHMLAERRYPLSRELMIRMLDHGMEVEDESEIVIALIHLFILWTTEDGKDLSNPFMVVMTYQKSYSIQHTMINVLSVEVVFSLPWIITFSRRLIQDTQTDCVQDTAQRMKLKRLKASTALMTRQTDAEQRRPTIKKLEVKQVEFKLGEDCWDIQDKRSKYCYVGVESQKYWLSRMSTVCQFKDRLVLPVYKGILKGLHLITGYVVSIL